MNEIMCNEQEPYVSAATCDLTLNAQGKLTANTLTGTLTGFDAAGAAHELTVKIDVSLYDYGTTEIQPMDLHNRYAAGDHAGRLCHDSAGTVCRRQ